MVSAEGKLRSGLAWLGPDDAERRNHPYRSPTLVYPFSRRRSSDNFFFTPGAPPDSVSHPSGVVPSRRWVSRTTTPSGPSVPFHPSDSSGSASAENPAPSADVCSCAKFSTPTRCRRLKIKPRVVTSGVSVKTRPQCVQLKHLFYSIRFEIRKKKK